MPRQRFKSHASSNLLQGIDAATTRIALLDAASFPRPGTAEWEAGDWFYACLQEGAAFEIVRVTGIAGNVLTVERGQGPFGASPFRAGAVCEIRPTGVGLEDISTAAAEGKAAGEAAAKVPDVERIAAVRAGEGLATVSRMVLDTLCDVAFGRADVRQADAHEAVVVSDTTFRAGQYHVLSVTAGTTQYQYLVLRDASFLALTARVPPTNFGTDSDAGSIWLQRELVTAEGTPSGIQVRIGRDLGSQPLVAFVQAGQYTLQAGTVSRKPGSFTGLEQTPAALGPLAGKDLGVNAAGTEVVGVDRTTTYAGLTDTSDDAPAVRASKYPQWSSDGVTLENVDGPDVGSTEVDEDVFAIAAASAQSVVLASAGTSTYDVQAFTAPASIDTGASQESTGLRINHAGLYSIDVLFDVDVTAAEAGDWGVELRRTNGMAGAGEVVHRVYGEMEPLAEVTASTRYRFSVQTVLTDLDQGDTLYLAVVYTAEAAGTLTFDVKASRLVLRRYRSVLGRPSLNLTDDQFQDSLERNTLGQDGVVIRPDQTGKTGIGLDPSKLPTPDLVSDRTLKGTGKAASPAGLADEAEAKLNGAVDALRAGEPAWTITPVSHSRGQAVGWRDYWTQAPQASTPVTDGVVAPADVTFGAGGRTYRLLEVGLYTGGNLTVLVGGPEGTAATLDEVPALPEGLEIEIAGVVYRREAMARDVRSVRRAWNAGSYTEAYLSFAWQVAGTPLAVGTNAEVKVLLPPTGRRVPTLNGGVGQVWSKAAAGQDPSWQDPTVPDDSVGPDQLDADTGAKQRALRERIGAAHAGETAFDLDAVDTAHAFKMLAVQETAPLEFAMTWDISSQQYRTGAVPLRGAATFRMDYTPVGASGLEPGVFVVTSTLPATTTLANLFAGKTVVSMRLQVASALGTFGTAFDIPVSRDTTISTVFAWKSTTARATNPPGLAGGAVPPPRRIRLNFVFSDGGVAFPDSGTHPQVTVDTPTLRRIIGAASSDRATTTTPGIVELADENDPANDQTRAATPDYVSKRLAAQPAGSSLSLSTQAQADAGVDTATAMTPALTRREIDRSTPKDVPLDHKRSVFGMILGTDHWSASAVVQVGPEQQAVPTAGAIVGYTYAASQVGGPGLVTAYIPLKVPLSQVSLISDHSGRLALIETDVVNRDFTGDELTLVTMSGGNAYYYATVRNLPASIQWRFETLTKLRPNPGVMDLPDWKRIFDAGAPTLLTSLPARFEPQRQYAIINTSTFQPWLDVTAVAGGNNDPFRVNDIGGALSGWQLIRFGPGAGSGIANQLVLRRPQSAAATVSPLAILLDGAQYTLNARGGGFTNDFIVAGYTVSGFGAGHHEVAVITGATIANIPDVVTYRPGIYIATDDHTLVAPRYDANVPDHEEVTVFNQSRPGLSISSTNAASRYSPLFEPTPRFRLDDKRGELEWLVTMTINDSANDGISFQADRLVRVKTFQVRRFIEGDGGLLDLVAITTGTSGGALLNTSNLYHESTAAKLGEHKFYAGKTFAAADGDPVYYTDITKWEGDAGTYSPSISYHAQCRYIPARYFSFSQTAQRTFAQIATGLNALAGAARLSWAALRGVPALVASLGGLATTGQGGKFLGLNTGATALEFKDAPSGATPTESEAHFTPSSSRASWGSVSTGSTSGRVIGAPTIRDIDLAADGALPDGITLASNVLTIRDAGRIRMDGAIIIESYNTAGNAQTAGNNSRSRVVLWIEKAASGSSTWTMIDRSASTSDYIRVGQPYFNHDCGYAYVHFHAEPMVAAGDRIRMRGAALYNQASTVQHRVLADNPDSNQLPGSSFAVIHE